MSSVADTLLAYNSKIAGVTDVVQMALISFSTKASVVVSPTTNATTFKKAVNRLSADGGTNWEDALQKVSSVSFENNEPTYVIFVSDGNPTYRNTADNTDDLPVTDNTQWYTYNMWGQTVPTDTYYTYYRDDYYRSKGVYGLGSDSQIGTNSRGQQVNLVNYSPTSMQRCYNNAVDDAQNLVNNGYKLYAIGAYGNVSWMQNLVKDTGEDASQYYFNASNTTDLNSALSQIAQAISSTLGDSNVKVDDGVTDLAAITAKTSETTSGFTYMKTDSNGTESAWNDAPSASYADGIVNWDLSSVGALDPNTTYSVSFDVWPGQSAYDLVADLNNGLKTYDSLTDAEKAQITATPNSDGTTSYTLKTNSSLVTSYTYNESDHTDNPSYTNGEMEVQSAKLNLKKAWVNNLDNESTPAVTLTVTKDGDAYISKELSSDNNWTDTVSLAPGLIRGSDVLVAGHDYTVTEKTTGSDTSDYHWELSAATYHPMIINGTMTMLQLTDQASAQYTINNQYYKVADDQATLTATNTRRSNLNLTKKVEGTDPNADKALFTYNVTVTDPTESDIWFSVMDAEGKLVSGANLTTSAEAQTDGYYKVASGTEFTVAMKAGWNLRVLNLPTGSTYSMEETAMPEGYHFVSAASTTLTNAVDGQTVTGTIDAPDNSYTVTYTNQYDGFFYVYHTSNNTIEAVSMTPYVTDPAATYDLAARIATGTYYGGYYNNYYYKGTVVTNGSDCGVSGSPRKYSGQSAAFNKSVAKAYTDNGSKLRPVAGQVYYLKEVPSGYLDSKIYISYHNYAVKDEAGNVTGYDRPISQVFAVSPIDDKNYNEIGFVVNEDKVSVALSKLSGYFDVVKGDSTERYTVKKLFNTLSRGYFATTTLSTAEGTYTVTPYWITPDGIEVKSTSSRTIVLGTTADTSTVDGVSVVTK